MAPVEVDLNMFEIDFLGMKEAEASRLSEV